MPYDISLSRGAKRDLLALRTSDRRKIIDAIETHLRHEPTRVSKSRIKRLRRMETPQYRLRVDTIRVFYDVVENEVEIIAVIPKNDVDAWLRREGVIAATPSADDDPNGNGEERDEDD